MDEIYKCYYWHLETLRIMKKNLKILKGEK